MSFQQGLSGLNVAAKNLDVIGNNVANSSTTGFKQSRAEFAEVYANSLAGAGGAQVGIGVKTAAVAQQFAQGNITATNNPMDLAINGGGFFRMNRSGTVNYSRYGQFEIDKSGFIVNADGARLTGYGANASGAIVTSSPVDMQVSTSDLSPQATGAVAGSSGAVASLNLDSRAPVIPPATTFDYTDPTTYNYSTSLSVYDSLGNAHTYSLYFKKESVTAVPTADWKVFATLTTPNKTTVDLSGGGATALGTLTFDSTGATASSPFTQTITSAQLGTGATALNFPIDLLKTTQFGSSFGVNSIVQDGYGSGRLTGFSFSSDGILQGRYSNGQTRNLGQVVLANFSNSQGLQPIGNNAWAETPASGQPLIGAPDTSSLGVLQSGALEDSNVDLTAELVNMITAQRVYQANAQSIKTQDAVLQTLVNIR